MLRLVGRLATKLKEREGSEMLYITEAKTMVLEYYFKIMAVDKVVFYQ
jgi:hypothetical protein